MQVAKYLQMALLVASLQLKVMVWVECAEKKGGNGVSVAGPCWRSLLLLEALC